ncbi:MAG: YggS family pyridoxal phosphate-dependent enzyme [bacterium]
MAGIDTALADVRRRIAVASGRSGRTDDVILVAVTKGVGIDLVRAAIAAGVTDFGENRIQEAAPKIHAMSGIEGSFLQGLYHEARWHMVGHLQRNKARKALELFDVIQSVDSLRLAADLSARATAPLEVFLQVNVSGYQQKYGFPPDKVETAATEIATLPRLNLTGLMTIAPMTDDPEAVRPAFRRLRELRDRLNSLDIPGLHLRHLSMGMSNDFEVAIEEGATIVRIGRAIFGQRA